MLILEGSKIMSFSDIFGSILQTFDTIMVYINTAVYDLISFLYQIFIALSSAEIFTADQYKEIASRIYIVIGVAGLFIISYGLLRAIIDPDNAGKNETSPSKIVPNVIKAVILVAFTPAIFNLAYRMQEVVVGSDVIPKIILGRDYAKGIDSETPEKDNTDFKFSYKESGRTFANKIFLEFLHPIREIDENGNEIGIEEDEIQVVDCYFGYCGGKNSNFAPKAATAKIAKYIEFVNSARYVVSLVTSPTEIVGTILKGNLKAKFYDKVVKSAKKIANGEEDEEAYSFAEAIYYVDNGLENFNTYANFASQINGKDGEKKLEYHGIFQLIVGIFVIYLFINFCIDFGVRAVKLGYFQLIAPIPILTLMIPGQKKVFDNWLKACISTYLDIFIRIAVIFFGLLMIHMLPDLFNSETLWGKSLFAANSGVQGFAKIFITIGILIFMKQAPKLISDIFGISGASFKLGVKDKLGEMAGVGKYVKSGLDKLDGGITGAAGAAWTAKLNGFKGDKFKNSIKYGWGHGVRSGGNQFNIQRQGFYSSEMQGEGKAGLLKSGRAYFDSELAKVDKKGKNDYKSINFERVRAYQNSEEWRNLYNSKFEEEEANIDGKIEAIKQEMEAINKDYDKKINEATQTLAEAKANQQAYDSLMLTYEQEKADHESYKQKRIDNLMLRYYEATNEKDISKQNAIKMKIDSIRADEFHDDELEAKIKGVKSNMKDVSALEKELHQLESSRVNDSKLKLHSERLEKLNETKASLTREKEYLENLERTYEDEREFYKTYGFSDLLKGINSEFKEGNTNGLPPHPDFKDVYDTNMQNLTREEVSSYITSAEGQKAIAVREMADKNLALGSKSDKKDDKKE